MLGWGAAAALRHRDSIANRNSSHAKGPRSSPSRCAPVHSPLVWLLHANGSLWGGDLLHCTIVFRDMRRALPVHGVLVSLLLPVIACDSALAPAPGGRVVIEVAPLTLPGITDATYLLTVSSPAGTVWSRSVSSTAYGDGSGAVSYVGTCDADANPNTITLELTGLADAAGPLDPALDFANPAPAGAPIELRADCLADADVAVRFDLTVARAARQGFFDVAIAFDDLFCSAKLDCVGSGGAPIELLFHPHSGERDTTAVLAFACTGGAGATTQLCLDPLVITCRLPGRPRRRPRKPEPDLSRPPEHERSVVPGGHLPRQRAHR